MAKVGDIVRFLNSVGGGRIVSIDGNIAHVEDEDGFDVPALLKECVVVMDAAAAKAATAPTTATPTTPGAASTQRQSAPSQAAPAPAPQPELPVVETAEGDTLNIVLAFVADDLHRLSQTAYSMELVNDSNYYIQFALSARAETDSRWHLLRAATVEPNIVLTLGQLSGADLQGMDRLAMQYVAYKADRDFTQKPVATVEHKLDTTKFFKLHCFKENPYFDEPVIAMTIVDNDRPYAPIKVSAEEIERALQRKKAADSRPVARPVKKQHRRATADLLEVDLHIGELTDTIRGLSNADMLNLQIDEFRRVMDANLKNHGMKIVFIHGKGEGVLRQALLKELNHRYKGHDVQDASFREYGFGATQVTIR
jgi:hypothetical protein